MGSRNDGTPLGILVVDYTPGEDNFGLAGSLLRENLEFRAKADDTLILNRGIVIARVDGVGVGTLEEATFAELGEDIYEYREPDDEPDSNDDDEDDEDFSDFEDFFFGDPDAEVVALADGDDVAVGGKGSDTLRGQNDSDSLYGGGGDDSLIGGNGADFVEGGGGSDAMFGNTGSDSLIGNAGADTIDAGSGDDAVDGRIGHDSLFGGPGTDTLYGGPDDDRLEGGSGRDRLNGGLGDDWIFGGRGADDLSGGKGADHFVVDQDETGDFVRSFQPGEDKVVFRGGNLAFSDLTFREVEDGTKIIAASASIILLGIDVGELDTSDFLFM